MKYHLRAFEKPIGGVIELTACGKKLNNISHFIFDTKGFIEHHDKALRCQSCLRNLTPGAKAKIVKLNDSKTKDFAKMIGFD